MTGEGQGDSYSGDRRKVVKAKKKQKRDRPVVVNFRYIKVYVSSGKGLILPPSESKAVRSSELTGNC